MGRKTVAAMLMIVFGSGVLLSGSSGYLGQTKTENSSATVSITSTAASSTTAGSAVTVTVTSTSTASVTTTTSTQTASVTTTTTTSITSTTTTTSTSTTTATKPFLKAVPSLVVVGSPVAISGGGLAPSTAYDVSVSTSNPYVGGAVVLASFVSNATGGIPAGASLSLPETPTTMENGTEMYLQVQVPALFGPANPPAATAPFVLAASATLNMTSAVRGHSVVISAHGLNALASYRVVINYVKSPFSPLNYTGTAVATLTPNSQGAGTATFTVPAGSAVGPTTVQLVVLTRGGTTPPGEPVGAEVLNSPPPIIVG